MPVNATVRTALQSFPIRLDLPYGDIKNAFNGACRRAEIKDFHFHDLRHPFASHPVMGGQDSTTVKELLGHKTLTMTLRYSHLAPAHTVKAVEFLDSILTENADYTKTTQLRRK